jgi:hypothetical protein
MSAILDAAQPYNAFWVAMAIATIFWLIYFFVKYASHPMVVIRYPRVMTLDLLASSLNCILQSFVNTSMFNSAVPCQPFMSFADAFDCFSNSVLIGRAVLFYMQARAMNHIRRNQLLDHIMDIIALFTAPGEYFRLKRQVAAIERETTVGSAKSESNSSIPSWAEKHGFLRFVAVQFVWFLVGWSYSFGSTVSGLGNEAFVYSEASNPLHCWAIYVTWYSSTVYILNVLCSAIILIAVFPVNDLVGLRNDLVLSLGIGIFFKLLNLLANVMYNFNTDWAIVSAYSYSPAALISPFISLSIAGFYVFRTLREDRFSMGKKKMSSHRSQRSINSSHNSEGFVNFNQFCKFWASTEGKQVVGNIAAKLYMLESIRFLHDTDEEQHIVPNFDRMCKEYIVDGAKWELNIPGAMKLQCQSANAGKNPDKMREAILDVRKEILQMLFPLIRHELAKEDRDASVEVEAQKVLSRTLDNPVVEATSA